MDSPHRKSDLVESNVNPPTRRQFLGTSAAITALTFAVPAIAQNKSPEAGRGDTEWRPAERYPDPLVETLDPSFEKLRVYNSRIERLATGYSWAEGPVWFGDQRCLLFSDVPNNRIVKWDDILGTASVFREGSNNSNGNTRDYSGRLVTCENVDRRVTRTEFDGSITVLADRFEGKRFNSPNDIVCRSDGSLWFTDPPYGLNLYEGHPSARELDNQGVYRIDGKSGKISMVADGLDAPNGLCFSPDESKLYVADSGSKPNGIWSYDVVDGGARLANGRCFIHCGDGPMEGVDGIRCDEQGNLWCAWGRGPSQDGVMVFSAQGKPLGRIRLPERCANVCFGGVKRNRLFMAASRSLYAVYVNTRGATRW